MPSEHCTHTHTPETHEREEEKVLSFMNAQKKRRHRFIVGAMVARFVFVTNEQVDDNTYRLDQWSWTREENKKKRVERVERVVKREEYRNSRWVIRLKQKPIYSTFKLKGHFKISIIQRKRNAVVRHEKTSEFTKFTDNFRRQLPNAR